MKIAIVGTQNIGKSTFVEDFITEWPAYHSPTIYRDTINDNNLPINKESCEETQEAILNAFVEEAAEAEGDYVIFDRCVLDNLAYTMWLNAKERVSDDFVKKTIDIVRETLTTFDIIYFLPITKHSPIPIVEGENRDEDPDFREEIDVIFKSLMHAYQQSSRVYYPFDHELGCPPIIEIFGTREERVQISKFYVNEDGDIFDEEDSMIDPDDLEGLDPDGLALANEVYGNE